MNRDAPTKAEHYSIDNHLTSSVFETTIRYLGGLLSAYELSDCKYSALLAKAKEVADTMSLAWVGVGLVVAGTRSRD